MSRALGVTSEAPVLALLFVVGLGVAPLVLARRRRGAHEADGSAIGERSIGQTAANYAYALVPLRIWHVAGALRFPSADGRPGSSSPSPERAVMDLVGWAVLGEPLWRWTGMRPGAVFPIQVGFILLGAIGSLAAGVPRLRARLPATSRGDPRGHGPASSLRWPRLASGSCRSRWKCAGSDLRDERVASTPPWLRVVCMTVGVITVAGATLHAHSGPPYPIVSDRDRRRLSDFRSGPIPTRPTMDRRPGSSG